MTINIIFIVINNNKYNILPISFQISTITLQIIHFFIKQNAVFLIRFDIFSNINEPLFINIQIHIYFRKDL